MTEHLRKAYRKIAKQPLAIIKAPEVTPEMVRRVGDALRHPTKPLVFDADCESVTLLQISCKSWARLAAGGDDALGAEARRWLAAKAVAW